MLRNEVMKRHLSIPGWGPVDVGSADLDGELQQKSYLRKPVRWDLGKGKGLRKIILKLCCGL